MKEVLQHNSDLINNYNQAAVFYTKQYGTVPSNISLTVQYLSGGGVSANVIANDITIVTSNAGIAAFNPTNTNASLATLIVNNAVPATGGRGGDTIEEIRLNTLNAFSAQLRAVTKDDYLVRALSLPAEYGVVSKAYITQEMSITETTQNTGLTATLNPL